MPLRKLASILFGRTGIIPLADKEERSVPVNLRGLADAVEDSLRSGTPVNWKMIELLSVSILKVALEVQSKAYQEKGGGSSVR